MFHSWQISIIRPLIWDSLLNMFCCYLANTCEIPRIHVTFSLVSHMSDRQFVLVSDPPVTCSSEGVLDIYIFFVFLDVSSFSLLTKWPRYRCPSRSRVSMSRWPSQSLSSHHHWVGSMLNSSIAFISSTGLKDNHCSVALLYDFNMKLPENKS